MRDEALVILIFITFYSKTSFISNCFLTALMFFFDDYLQRMILLKNLKFCWIHIWK